MENREELLEKIKAQGDVVRKLKADKAEKSMDLSSLLKNLEALDNQLTEFSYIGGHYTPTSLDKQAFDVLKAENGHFSSSFVSLSRWYRHIESFDLVERQNFPQMPLSSATGLNSPYKQKMVKEFPVQSSPALSCLIFWFCMFIPLSFEILQI